MKIFNYAYIVAFGPALVLGMSGCKKDQSSAPNTVMAAYHAIISNSHKTFLSTLEGKAHSELLGKKKFLALRSDFYRLEKVYVARSELIEATRDAQGRVEKELFQFETEGRDRSTGKLLIFRTLRVVCRSNYETKRSGEIKVHKNCRIFDIE